jgi:hypothetical protein
MSYLRYPMLASLALVVASCGDSSGPTGGGCDEPITVTVSSTTSPSISWTPSCTVAVIQVSQINEPVDSLRTKWWVQTEGNSIRPPVSYGSTPPGATALLGPKPLFGGTQYQVILLVRDPTTGQPFEAGRAQFTP